MIFNHLLAIFLKSNNINCIHNYENWQKLSNLMLIYFFFLTIISQLPLRRTVEDIWAVPPKFPPCENKSDFI